LEVHTTYIEVKADTYRLLMYRRN